MAFIRVKKITIKPKNRKRVKRKIYIRRVKAVKR